MKQLALPSLWSIEVDTISKWDDRTCASQALNERYWTDSKIWSWFSVVCPNEVVALGKPVEMFTVGVTSGNSKHSSASISSGVASISSVKGLYSSIMGEVGGTLEGESVSLHSKWTIDWFFLLLLGALKIVGIIGPLEDVEGLSWFLEKF